MSPQATGAKGFLIDLDGTLVSGRQLLPGAAELLRVLEDRFVIVSNDSEHMPEQLSRRFRDWGVRVAPEQIVLAGACAIETIAEDRPGARLMPLASPVLRRHARQSGLEIDEISPEIVLVTRDRRFNYAKLAAAAEAVHRGARLVLANPDVSHPGPQGQPVPEAGALAAALLACTGPVECLVVGKPEPAMFAAACRRLGLRPEDVVMIGDNPATDGAGARRMGMPFVQVAPGGLLQLLPVAAGEAPLQLAQAS